MPSLQGKTVSEPRGQGSLPSVAVRCYRIMMHKAEILELIAPVPVYRGVDALCGLSGELA